MKLKILSVLSLMSFQSALAQGPYLGVVNKADGTASFINLLTQATDFTLPVGYFPHEITSSPEGRYAYVSNYGKDHVRSNSPLNRPGTTLTVIDIQKREIAATLKLGTEPCAPHGMVSSQDGHRLYVTCEAREEILVLDINTKSLHHIPTSQAQSHMVVISPDETRAFTSNFSAGSVSVMNLITRTVEKVIPVGPGTEGLSISDDGKYIYASAVLGGFFVKIDAQTLQVLAQVPTEKSPVRVVPTPDGKHLLVNCSAAGLVQIFDAASLRLIKNIPVGHQPIGLVIPNNDYAYSAPMLENTVVKINLKTYEIEARMPTGTKPDGIAFIPVL